MSHMTYEWVTSHMNEWCHIRMIYVTYESVTSHVNESCHIWRSHVTYEGVMSRMKESCHMRICHVTCESVISRVKKSCHVYMSHVTPINTQEVRGTYHIWMSHVVKIKWFMSHIWMRHVTHMNESCHTHECAESAMAGTRREQFTFTLASTISNSYVKLPIWIWHDLSKRDIWLIWVHLLLQSTFTLASTI